MIWRKNYNLQCKWFHIFALFLYRLDRTGQSQNITKNIRTNRGTKQSETSDDTAEKPVKTKYYNTYYILWIILQSPCNAQSEISQWRLLGLFACLVVLNANFNNISFILWRSVLLVEETGEPAENHRPVTSLWQTLSHNGVHIALITTSVVIGTDCIGSCKSNYHTITAMTHPDYWRLRYYRKNISAI